MQIKHNNIISDFNKSTVILFILFIFTPFKASAGSVHESAVNGIKVYITSFRGDADLIVYKTKFESEAKGNDAIWYFSDFASDSHNITYTQFRSEANIIVYFTTYRADATWVNANHSLVGKLE